MSIRFEGFEAGDDDRRIFQSTNHLDFEEAVSAAIEHQRGNRPVSLWRHPIQWLDNPRITLGNRHR